MKLFFIIGLNPNMCIQPHSGEKYVFGDAEFDVLFTCEDLYPVCISNFNDSSLVLMMKLAGKKVLWLGDIQKQGAEYMCRKYPKEIFECDILQVGHHGYGGACMDYNEIGGLHFVIKHATLKLGKIKMIRGVR